MASKINGGGGGGDSVRSGTESDVGEGGSENWRGIREAIESVGSAGSGSG